MSMTIPTPLLVLPDGVPAPWPPRAADRTGWPRGEWDGEPDFDGWTDGRTGFSCIAVRNWLLGMWCGYVAVTRKHSLFGLDYMEISSIDGLEEVTFSSWGEDTHLHWFGTHFGDGPSFMPGYADGRGPGRIYRPLGIAKEGVTILAKALSRVEGKR